MKRLFLSLCMSMILLFAWWGLVGYMQFGDSLPDRHLDLYTMVNRFRVDFNYTTFSGTWNSLVNATKSINDTSPIVKAIAGRFDGGKGLSTSSGFAFVLNAVNALFNPIAQIYNLFVIPIFIIIVTLPILGTFLQVTSAIVDFVISPVFI